MPDEPLDHLLRASLPWRADRLTECGRPADTVASVITADELAARVRRDGKRRTAFTVCMTCADRAGYATTWEEHPIGVLYRELHRVGAHRPTGAPPNPDFETTTAELRAIAALVAAHRDEFDAYLAGLRTTVSLTDRRARRHRRSGG